MIILSSISSGLKFWSVSHTAVYKKTVNQISFQVDSHVDIFYNLQIQVLDL